MNNIRFAFFGTPRMAVTVLDELKTADLLPIVIFCAPDKPVGRKKVVTPPAAKMWAQEHNVPVEQPTNKKELFAAIQKYELDVSLVAAYNIIIGPKALKHPKHGTLNIHPSLLPRHRGPAPIQQTILDGDKKTGVCLMQLDEEVDHGPLVACKEAELSGAETYLDLEESLSKLGAQLFIQNIENYLSGRSDLSAQNHEDATFSKRFVAADARVDLKNDSRVEIDRKVRALNPEPGTWTELETKRGAVRLKILSGSIREDTYTPSLVNPAGKNKMQWEDFKRGYLL